MKIKAKKTYNTLGDIANFKSLLSCSTHLRLKAGKTVDWELDIPKDLMKHLTEIKEKKGDK